jgi:hypothetical protein
LGGFGVICRINEFLDFGGEKEEAAVSVQNNFQSTQKCELFFLKTTHSCGVSPGNPAMGAPKNSSPEIRRRSTGAFRRRLRKDFVV